MSLPNRNEGEVELNGSHFLQEVHLDTTRVAWQRNLTDRVGRLVGQSVGWLVGGWVWCLLCFTADDLTWFLVCCCALSLLLGCRGVSLGMGPIGVGCR